MASQGNKGMIELAAAITAQDQKVASLHRIMDAMPRTGSKYAPLVRQAEIDLDALCDMLRDAVQKEIADGDREA